MASTTKLQKIGRVAVGVLVAGLMTGLASLASATTNCNISADSRQDQAAVALDNEERATLNLINAFRAERGLPALRLTSRLSRPAAWASNDSALRGFSPSNHIDSLGRDIPTRLKQCSYTDHGRASEINYCGWGSRGRGRVVEEVAAAPGCHARPARHRDRYRPGLHQQGALDGEHGRQDSPQAARQKALTSRAVTMNNDEAMTQNVLSPA